MSSVKRSSPSQMTPPSNKKARSSLALSDLVALSRQELHDLSPAELVDAVAALQDAYSKAVLDLDREKKKKAPLAALNGMQQEE
ncbi:hypothetical protein JCM10450v2_002614 [Rhodotorula kratochvilovae]